MAHIRCDESTWVTQLYILLWNRQRFRIYKFHFPFLFFFYFLPKIRANCANVEVNLKFNALKYEYQTESIKNKWLQFVLSYSIPLFFFLFWCLSINSPTQHSTTKSTERTEHTLHVPHRFFSAHSLENKWWWKQYSDGFFSSFFSCFMTWKSVSFYALISFWDFSFGYVDIIWI